MGQLSGYPQVSSPVSTDLIPVTRSGSVKNIQYSNLGTTSPSRTTIVTVGVTGQVADYICDGTADEVEINAAITAANAAGAGEVQLREGSFFVNATITPKSFVKLIGAGKQKTFITFSPTATASNLIASGSATLFNFEISNMTFDAAGLMKGIFNCSTIVQGMEVHDCEFLNMACDNSHSHWPIHLGILTDGNELGTASYNVRIYNNLFSNLMCGTFEVILLPNVRESFIHHNKFINNSTAGTSEMSFYSQNWDCIYSDNIHIDWSDRAIHAGEATRISIINNILTNSVDTSPIGIDIRNIANSKVSNNNITFPASNTGTAINHFDANVGRDGHAQVNPNSSNIDISNNILTNAFYGISNFASGGANYAYKYFTITNNKFYNCLKSPIRFGPNIVSASMDIEFIYVRYNVVHSWSGDIEGAISFYGDSSTPTHIKNIFIDNNYIEDNTTGVTSGAIRLVAATAKTITNNYIVASGSFGAIATSSGGSFLLARNNIGYNPVGLVTVTVPSSAASTTAAAYDQIFHITAGVSTVACAITNAAGTSQTVATIPASSFGTVYVPAGSTLTPTYTNAPTWTVQAN